MILSRQNLLLSAAVFFISAQGFGEFISRDLVEPVKGWDSYIYRDLDNDQSVYADTADGRIARVTLTGPYGFEGGEGVELHPYAIQTLASMYEVCLFSEDAPTGEKKVKLANAIYLARKSIGVDFSETLKKLGVVPTKLNSSLKHMKLEFPEDLSSFIYRRLSNVQAKVEIIDIPGFGSERILTKKIESKQFRMTAIMRESTDQYKTTFETWNNQNVFESEKIKIIEGLGNFASDFHSAIFSNFENNGRYRDSADESLSEKDQGISSLSMASSYKLVFRKFDNIVYFHMEYAPTGELDRSFASEFVTSEIPTLLESSKFEVSSPKERSRATVQSRATYSGRGSPPSSSGGGPRNSTYHSGSSTYYRGLDGVTREAVRSPTGP